MKQKLHVPRRALAGVGIAAAVATAVLLGASSSSAAGPAAHPINVSPEVSGPQTVSTSSVHFSCQDRPIDGSQGLRCYQPAQVQAAYGYSGLLASGINGKGKTIVIIDAYSNPFIGQDLQIEDSEFSLPAPQSFTTLPKPVAPPAFDPNDPNQDGWAEEITLDVEWAHVMAPGAKIVLAEAASNNDADILATTKYVIDHHIGDVISQSFGEAESCMDPTLLAQQHELFSRATREGYTLFASSGDSGASQFSCDGSSAIESASTPASDPNVTGVGGTTLNADGNSGAYIGETAWTESLLGCNPPAVDFPFDVNCSGGGFSTIYGRPSWQAPQVKGKERKERGVPDVAYDAGVNGGVLTHCGICNLLSGLDPADPTVYFLFGGTSAGSPQWAALTADADQMAHHDLGNINQTLYRIGQSAHGPDRGHGGSALHDITTGNNDVQEIGGAGFNTGKGWDPVTGLGTPNAANLLPALAKRH